MWGPWAVPAAVGHVLDIIILGVGAIPVGLEVFSQDGEVVREGVCEARGSFTPAGEVVRPLWQIADDDSRFVTRV
jgi:hypothetical protein